MAQIGLVLVPKLTFISDTHNYETKLTAAIIEGGRPDVLVHCGDCTDGGTTQELKSVAAWFKMLKQKDYVGEIVLVAGNHDRGLRSPSNQALFTRIGIHYLQDSAVTLHGLRFYGSPWSGFMSEWGFQLPSEDGGPGPYVWESIPSNTDVLVTHSPPAYIRDEDGGVRWGCPYLRKRIDEGYLKPRVHAFGHVHTQHGITVNDSTLFLNASSWKGERRWMNLPISVELGLKPAT